LRCEFEYNCERGWYRYSRNLHRYYNANIWRRQHWRHDGDGEAEAFSTVGMHEDVARGVDAREVGRRQILVEVDHRSARARGVEFADHGLSGLTFVEGVAAHGLHHQTDVVGGPEGLAPGDKFDEEGLLFVGDNGSILCEFEGGNPRILPESRMRAYVQPPQTLPRSPGNNREWIDAAKGGKPGGANFEFEALVTESLLVGNVALRTREKLDWDGKNLRFTNVAAANDLVHRPYREGWTL